MSNFKLATLWIGYLSGDDVSTNVEDDQGLSSTKGSSLQSMAADMSLGPCSLPAMTTSAQTMSVGAWSTTRMWITVGDHLSPLLFSFFFCMHSFFPLVLVYCTYVYVCVISMACTAIAHNDIHVNVISC